MSHTLSRRAALTATATGVALAAALPARAVEDQDRAEWLGLWQDYVDKAKAAYAVDWPFRDDASPSAVRRRALWDAMDAAKDGIIDRPAFTITGLAVKLALARERDNIEPGGFAHGALWAVTDDALNLAGLPEDMGLDLDGDDDEGAAS